MVQWSLSTTPHVMHARCREGLKHWQTINLNHSLSLLWAHHSRMNWTHCMHAYAHSMHPHASDRAPTTLYDVMFNMSIWNKNRSFDRVKTHKAVSPDGISGCVCVQWATISGLYRQFNVSLQNSSVPMYFKNTTIVPVPKKNKETCFNDFRPFGEWYILLMHWDTSSVM